MPTSSRLLFLLPLFLLSSSLVAGDFLDGLPKCWRSCINNSNDLNCDGWDIPCICKASRGAFITDTVACARSTCDSPHWSIDLFLGPLELACEVVGQKIPQSIISSAECAATQSTAAPTSTSSARHTSKAQTHRSDVQTTVYITETYTTTITQTTTDDAGSTLYIIIPVIVEPSTILYGTASTLTDKGVAASTTTDFAISTIVVSPVPVSSSAAVTSAPQQASQTKSQTSSTSSKKTAETNNSNGSPFTNPQAAASTQTRSWVLAGLGLLVALF
ncbi:hypothetical protein K432DRAFT_443001 [Lepidopterella palustris CBS 459.81]|uniref:CFEM domain-containing protein n=1 Tax=Lepidopterella palustris CBS 459.81 TaxID=1314670 RepID=A0A8E2EB24_9PEZI|nr:hypothetical protein K432DRAFT_443001 [Lepidopterella palustris CBS 459.81]